MVLKVFSNLNDSMIFSMIVFLLFLGVTPPIILEVHRKLPNKLLAKSQKIIQPPYLNIKLSFLAGTVFSAD